MLDMFLKMLEDTSAKLNGKPSAEIMMKMKENRLRQ
jgi:hypothetical protein